MPRQDFNSKMQLAITTSQQKVLTRLNLAIHFLRIQWLIEVKSKEVLSAETLVSLVLMEYQSGFI